MRYIRKIVYFWGICDLVFVLFSIIGAFVYGEVPIYHHIKLIIESFRTSPDLIRNWITVGLSILEVSMIASSYLLLRQNRFAAIVCYIQTPFRLLLVKSSIPFIQLHVDSNNPWIYLLLIFLVESAKVATLIIWHYKKLYLKDESWTYDPEDAMNDTNTEPFKM